jgi:hypothetical protein
MADIQSTLVPLELSEDGVTWKTVVCLEGYNIPVSTATTETETFCGKSVGLGAKTFNPTGNAVCKADNSTNEVTYKEMLDWQLNNTLIYFRSAYPSGGSVSAPVFLAGQCYVTETDLIFQTSDAVKFSFTLLGTGTLDNTHPFTA